MNTFRQEPGEPYGRFVRLVSLHDLSVADVERSTVVMDPGALLPSTPNRNGRWLIVELCVSTQYKPDYVAHVYTMNHELFFSHEFHEAPYRKRRSAKTEPSQKVGVVAARLGPIHTF